MSNGKSCELGQLSYKLQAIAIAVHDATDICQGDPKAILALLRQLEQLHREIRDGAFQESLPDNRQALYALLKDIESEGGWPYIERMRLQAFLANMLQDAEENTTDGVSKDVEGDRSFGW
jgi:5'-deoxynucleotidase YfbR-like HD superfamily hydrolase